MFTRFASFDNHIVMTKTALEKVEKGKSSDDKTKKVNLTAIYLNVIPALEKARDELKEVHEQMVEEPLKDEVGAWVKQMEDLEVAILEKTIGTVRSSGILKEEGLPEVGQPDETKITPEMINGKLDLPKAASVEPVQFQDSLPQDLMTRLERVLAQRA